jgi:hypothetical protein
MILTCISDLLHNNDLGCFHSDLGLFQNVLFSTTLVDRERQGRSLFQQ